MYIVQSSGTQYIYILDLIYWKMYGRNLYKIKIKDCGLQKVFFIHFFIKDNKIFRIKSKDHNKTEDYDWVFVMNEILDNNKESII